MGFRGTVQQLNDLSDVSAPAPTNGQVLAFNAGTGKFEPVAPSGGGGLTALVDDLTPQLGGNLDCAGLSLTNGRAIECTNGNGIASQIGAAAFGYFSNYGGVEQIAASAKGSMAVGKVSAIGYTVSLTASAYGALAHGYAFDSYYGDAQILASGQGATAFGYSEQSNIQASGRGALAGGSAYGGHEIKATAPGALAFGHASSSSISATAANAFQFGPGVNNQSGSLAVGNTAGTKTLRLRPGHSYMGAATNGDLWIEGNAIWFTANNNHYYILGAV